MRMVRCPSQVWQRARLNVNQSYWCIHASWALFWTLFGGRRGNRWWRQAYLTTHFDWCIWCLETMPQFDLTLSRNETHYFTNAWKNVENKAIQASMGGLVRPPIWWLNEASKLGRHVVWRGSVHNSAFVQNFTTKPATMSTNLCFSELLCFTLSWNQLHYYDYELHYFFYYYTILFLSIFHVFLCTFVLCCQFFVDYTILFAITLFFTQTATMDIILWLNQKGKRKPIIRWRWIQE